MNNYIEGIVFFRSDGSSMLQTEDNLITLLTDGKAVKVRNGEKWINGIHIGGDIIHSGGKEPLQSGEKIRIRK